MPVASNLATGYASAVLADAPLGYWRLGEASGSTAIDASGGNRSASYEAGVVYGRTGALAGDPDRAVALSDAAIVLPTSVNPWGGNFTIEAWVKPHSTPVAGDRDGVLIWESYQQRGFRTGWTASYEPVFWTGESGGAGEVFATKAMTPGAWNHVAYVRTGSTLSIFVNGAAAGTGSITLVAPAATEPARCIGACAGKDTDGDFDEVAVYATALSATRIAAHYAAAAPGGGPGSGPWSVPFLGRSPSGAISISDQSNVTISGKQFVNLGNGVVAISINNCTNVTITENDFDSVTGAIYVLNSHNVTITWNRYRNIGNGTIGSGHSNFVQLNTTFDGYIGHNKGKDGRTEDIISIYKSGGSSVNSRLIIEYNQFEGTNWTSASGSGIMLGDDGGSHVIARFNTMLTPGQVGIGVASGTDMHVTDNVLYGAQRTGANVGLSVWNQYPSACNNIEVAHNQVKWFNESGAENPYWDGENCGTVSGEATNNLDAQLDPGTMHVTL